MNKLSTERIDYPYTDRWVFPIVMQDPDICRQFLERLFPDRKIRELHLHNDYSMVTPEKVISVSATGRGIRLDVLFEDSSTVYDIEMQLTSYDSMPLRTRYYHSMMDAASLKRGDDFSKLKPQYVIFVCDFDPFGEGEPLYDFRMVFPKTGLYLDEKTYTIFMNTKADESLVPEGLKAYFRYVNSGESDGCDVFINEIHERVKEVNRDPEWRGVLMTLREEMAIINSDQLKEVAEKTESTLLASLVKDNILTKDEAIKRSSNPELLETLLND